MLQTPNNSCGVFGKHVRAGGIALVFALLTGCDNGFSNADIDALKNDIKVEFGKRALRVTGSDLTRDSNHQVSGLVTVQMETPMGPREFFTPCVATMDQGSRHYTWKCEQVP